MYIICLYYSLASKGIQMAVFYCGLICLWIHTDMLNFVKSRTMFNFNSWYLDVGKLGFILTSHLWKIYYLLNTIWTN